MYKGYNSWPTSRDSTRDAKCGEMRLEQIDKVGSKTDCIIRAYELINGILNVLKRCL